MSRKWLKWPYWSLFVCFYFRICFACEWKWSVTIFTVHCSKTENKSIGKIPLKRGEILLIINCKISHHLWWSNRLKISEWHELHHRIDTAQQPNTHLHIISEQSNRICCCCCCRSEAAYKEKSYSGTKAINSFIQTRLE